MGKVKKIGIWPIVDWAATLTPSLIGKSEKNNSNERVFWRNDEPMATSQEPVTTWTVTYGQIIYTFAIFLQRKICIFGAENRPRQQWTMATTKFCEGAITMCQCKNLLRWLWEKSFAMDEFVCYKKMCNGILHMGNIFLRKSVISGSDSLSLNRKWSIARWFVVKTVFFSSETFC